jgi:lysozyme family protein
MTFEQALKEVLRHEGGYITAKVDGHETNMGITKETASTYGYHGDMKTIPLPLVENIYFNGYWIAAKCDKLPLAINFHVFDTAVNQGVKTAGIILQRALVIEADGIIGPKTLMCAAQMKPDYLVRRFYAERIRRYTETKNFTTFGRGWMARISDNLAIDIKV